MEPLLRGYAPRDYLCVACFRARVVTRRFPRILPAAPGCSFFLTRLKASWSSLSLSRVRPSCIFFHLHYFPSLVMFSTSCFRISSIHPIVSVVFPRSVFSFLALPFKHVSLLVRGTTTKTIISVGIRGKRHLAGVQHHAHSTGRVGGGASSQAKGAARLAHVALPRTGNSQELPGEYFTLSPSKEYNCTMFVKVVH